MRSSRDPEINKAKNRVLSPSKGVGPCPYFLPYPCAVFCRSASRAGIRRHGTLCVGAAGRFAAVCCCVCGGGASCRIPVVWLVLAPVPAPASAASVPAVPRAASFPSSILYFPLPLIVVRRSKYNIYITIINHMYTTYSHIDIDTDTDIQLLRDTGSGYTYRYRGIGTKREILWI